MSAPYQIPDLGSTRGSALGQDAAMIIERRSMPEPNSGCWLWLGATNQQELRDYMRSVDDDLRRRP